MYGRVQNEFSFSEYDDSNGDGGDDEDGNNATDTAGGAGGSRLVVSYTCTQTLHNIRSPCLSITAENLYECLASRAPDIQLQSVSHSIKLSCP
jgi:hypothetical protein